MIHHLKETLITFLPSAGWFLAALETSNILLKVIAGLLTIGWLIIRIAIAWKEYKKNNNES